MQGGLHGGGGGVCRVAVQRLGRKGRVLSLNHSLPLQWSGARVRAVWLGFNPNDPETLDCLLFACSRSGVPHALDAAE